ncbi:hypothetical protein CLV30_13313 [Haloactinopolyspora alba]|uniref:DUF8129 domain-containing protein n=1 Tax=Haloactinopolyspora alba TaxID=648780 RepID=A0A2P8D3T3_9ACTN|nr:hypothetical protein [Haloactinopolyspora alba]PSK91880.1 hypothetical protein CLV30_13313 [Haloactinopolyspora alba]
MAHEHEPGGVPSRSELPLPDYDHLAVGPLHQRIRTLDEEGVTRLLAYEHAHADRLPVVEVLEQRIAELQAGAEPTGGSPEGTQPENAQAPHGGSPVSPGTQAPPADPPPPHGDPTNIRKAHK